MALTFSQSKGGAQKSELNSLKYVNGENTFRIVGDILPRYVYWVEGENKKNIPMECLAFDRDAEAFLNTEKDWVKVYMPKLNCTWSYVTQAVVPDSDNPGQFKVKVVNLKKKYWEQVITAAEDLGDPTDLETGWDIRLMRTKTGPLPFNVEYQLQALKCKSRPLSAEEQEAIKDLKSMDEVMIRPTPEAQKELLDRITGAAKENTDEEAIDKEFAVG